MNSGCLQGQAPVPFGGAGGEGGTGGTGGDLGPCGIDCSKIETPTCTVAVCNTGQVVGTINTCVVVPAPSGTSCDDGKFCTIADSCEEGVCVGGGKNVCGLAVSPCESVLCYEDTKTCDVTPVNDGTECTPEDLCEVNGVCQLGTCIGEPKDCSFSPAAECNTVGCDPQTGKCVGLPDTNKDDTPCVLTGDLCNTNKTCKNGACQGGIPKDCSGLTVGCQVGECSADNGSCVPMPAPVGTKCTEGLHECDVGACDVKGTCVAAAAPNGSACNDHNACTTQDSCQAGDCGGNNVANCVLYLNEGFESCPAGWTLGGDWECGTPENVGPLESHTGAGCIGTQIAGLYHVSQSYNTAVADSPAINLTMATAPQLTFWAWDHTEGGTFDGWNIKVSTNGGQSFTQVNTVTPPYPHTINGQKAWGGNHSADGWQLYNADLTAFAGQTIILRFAFRSDGATVYPGVYIDDVVVAEPLQSPIFITSTSPLPDVYANKAYTHQLTRIGGTPAAVWSIKPGGTNSAWVTIDPATGMLGGTPSSAEVGPVEFTVHVEEPSLPSNYDDKTFTLNVDKAAFYTSFEETCPGGWTLTGDWQCGVPTVVGPATAYVGTQCIATQIAGQYKDLQSFNNTTATSPGIDLTGIGSPKMTFRMWVDTEGSTYDGFNLQISNDAGVNYVILTTVTPSYPLTVAGKPAWGGHQQAVGWQLVQADLSAYAGQSIRMRFAFQSDSSGVFPGVYIDDILIN
ncbi:MAG: immune inhibitor A [Polyangiaceae bacterium]|nr:immune inhibitor A [Polyangiaceae bacterium]